MKDLIQEGRKIQETFKQNVLKKQSLNEGKLTDMVHQITKLAKQEVDSRFDELAQFFDMEKIKRDNPQFSIQQVESELIQTFKNANPVPTEGVVNEDFASFFASIKNNIRSFVTNVSTFIKGLSLIPSAVRAIKYLKDPKGFMRYYSENMTTDGIKYKGLPKIQTASESVAMNELTFDINDPGTVTAITWLGTISIMMLVMVVWIIRAAIDQSQMKRQGRESNANHRAIYGNYPYNKQS